MSPPDYKNITTHNNIPSALVMSSVLTVMENLDILRVQEGRNPSNQDWMTMIQIQSQRPKKNAKQTCEFDPKSAFCAYTRKRMKAAKVLNFWTVLWSVFILYGLTSFQSHIKYNNSAKSSQPNGLTSNFTNDISWQKTNQTLQWPSCVWRHI